MPGPGAGLWTSHARQGQEGNHALAPIRLGQADHQVDQYLDREKELRFTLGKEGSQVLPSFLGHVS